MFLSLVNSNGFQKSLLYGAGIIMERAATLAERKFTEADLARHLECGRPLSLLAQRDSDAKEDVEASRFSALGKLSELALQTIANLESQFLTSYIQTVFYLTCV